MADRLKRPYRKSEEGPRSLLQYVFANLKWGIRWGLTFGCIFAAWGLVVFVFGGPSAFTRYNVTVTQVGGLYVGIGIVGGMILGLLRPIARWRLGAATIGALVVIPMTLALLSFWGELIPWKPANTFLIIVCPLTLGAPSGFVLHEIFVARRSRHRS